MWIALLAMGLVGVAAEDGATPLFDGKSLDGWVAEGASETVIDGAKAPVWVVEDGQIVCRGKGFGFLRYKEREFDDFTFHVEFRMAPKCNSGIGVRTRPFDPADSRGTRPSLYSYEIQLIDDVGKAPDVHSSGSLYRYVAPRENALKPAGEWNALDVTCQGPRIRVVLNGKTIQDVDQREVAAIKDKPLRGYVCLQNHGGTIAFRTVEIRDVKPD
ncbi:MAG: hypothetical protein BGO49_09510 [Planctomycetales bacterium 71-10]|nr:MAG: hypothetical protein BGO49_09510 [Planctomycetales bacterium 71-10]